MVHLFVRLLDTRDKVGRQLLLLNARIQKPLISVLYVLLRLNARLK